MAIVFSRTGVRDYDEWLRVFESHEKIREDGNISVVGIFRNAAEPDDLLIAIDVPDPDAFGEMLKTPMLVNAIRESGISTDVEYWAGDPLATVPLSD